MELNAAFKLANAFTRWAAKHDSPIWVAPVQSRRGTEVGLIVTTQPAGLDAVIHAAAGPECRHTMELVSRAGQRTCFRYRCNKAGATGCALIGSAMDALRPVLGAHGFVQSLRFERDGAQAHMVWPPGGPDTADQLNELLETHGPALGKFGFRMLDLRDSTQGLMEASLGGPQLRGSELETMLVALRHGYYESPRQCTMEDIAGHFGLSKSAIYHRIHAAEKEAVRQLAAHTALLDKRGFGDEARGRL